MASQVLKISLNTISIGLVLGGLFLLSACQQGASGIAGQPASGISGDSSQAGSGLRPLSANVKGEKIGNGPVRVALLLPTGAQGAAGQIAGQLANAAKLAMRDFGANRLQVVLKDTKGRGADAALAATEARDEGASLIIGPLFSANVSAASGVAQPSRIPMLALTSDVNRARRGVYMMSFSPNNNISRTLNYGLTLGANNVIALLPNNAYGQLAERELRTTLDSGGGQVVSVVKYDRDEASQIAAARSVVLSLPTANALFIPDGGAVPSTLLKAIRSGGGNLNGMQIMGSGQWESVNVNDPALDRAYFAAADKANFETFAQRYQAVYGQRPITNAALVYDAISLTSELVRRNGQDPFSFRAIESTSGFSGASGVFRFTSNGQVQRGLVINRIENKSVVTVSPAPSSFASRR